jgi:hypothetical protein
VSDGVSAATGAATSAAGAATDAANSAAGAATSAAGAATGAANSAVDGLTGGGRGLGGEAVPGFTARGLFGLETPEYGRISHSVERSVTKGKHGYKPAHAYKPMHDHKPKHSKGPKVVETLSGDAPETTGSRRRMCGDILGDPSAYDPALVQLCRRVSTR